MLTNKYGCGWQVPNYVQSNMNELQRRKKTAKTT